jgi:hypothetical protein
MSGSNAIAPPMVHCREGTPESRTAASPRMMPLSAAGTVTIAARLGPDRIESAERLADVVATWIVESCRCFPGREADVASIPGVNTIAAHNRRPVPLLAAFFVALGCQVRKAIDTVNYFLERRFSEFAGVPYQNPVVRQEWEDLWETEAER